VTDGNGTPGSGGNGKVIGDGPSGSGGNAIGDGTPGSDGDRNGDREAGGSGYRFGVLGAAQVLRPDGTEAPLQGPRLRALLTALAAAAGRSVPAGALAAQLWTDTPPADEIAALQALVGRLRRALGRDAVRSAPGGYRLAARPDDIDLFRFERLASDGAAALDAGNPATAARLLDEALALWRGPALADLPGRGTDPLAARAQARHIEARRTRLAAEVALGRPQAALPGLAELAADRPLDEPLAALRIRALQAAGRPAEALQAYEGVRSALAARLGTDPGPELRALHAELLAADGEPVRHRAPAPGNLRARLTSFVGRDAELTGLAGQVRRHRLITLLGPGGVGKTRLALEAADAARDRPPADTWPDGVWLAELAPVRDEADVAETVLTVLGAREPLTWTADAGARDPLARLVEYCGRRRLLLVLDNCEHVVGAAARLADTVLAACPGVTVLATSREPLGVPGEAVRPVDPLPEAAALRLLAERGGSARPAFHVSDDPEACAEICRRLDGLPLAIELAAARLRALTPRQIADRLDDRFRLLTGGSRTALPRQQTLRAVVDWSWELLDTAERTVLRRLAVFSGGCTLALAEEVCAEPGTLDRLTSLVDKSLVVAAPAPDGTMRYRLLETVADYAAERLTEAGEREATARRHLTSYRELVRTGERELRGPGQTAWLRTFEAEHDNIRAALRTAVELGEEQEGLCVVLCLNWFWQLRGRVTDARTWSAAVAALGPDPFLPPVRHAVPMHSRCTDAPPPWDDETLWEARRGVRLMAFASDGSQGAAALEKPENRAYLEAIAATYRPGMPQNCRHPGAMWFFVRLLLGEFAGLPDTMAATVESARAHGDDADIGFALLMRAKLLQEEGTDAAGALARFEAVGDRWGIAESLSARGEAHDRAGRYAEAARDFERAMASAERIGAHSQVTVFQARLASVRLRLATTPAEREHAEHMLLAAAEAARTYNVEAVSTARLLLAQHYGRTGRVPLARHQLDLIERELIPGIAEMFTGMLLGLHAWLDCLDGAHARARERLAEAVGRLETLAYLVAPHMVLGQFPTAAWAMAGDGDPSDGARLLGAYDRHVAGLAGTGFRQLPVDAETEVRDRAERELRAVLDDASFARAHAEGGALGLKEAAALVR
jgi:predicted ATPase/DNA-binding SARP family transcriptional activator